MPDDPVDRSARAYIAKGAAEGAMAAAQRITEAAGVGLNEVLATLQELRPGKPTGEEYLVVAAPPAIAVGTAPAATVSVSGADVGSTAEGFSVVRQADIDDLANQIARSGPEAILNPAQRRLFAIDSIAAVYPVLSQNCRRPCSMRRSWLGPSRLSWSSLGASNPAGQIRAGPAQMRSARGRRARAKPPQPPLV